MLSTNKEKTSPKEKCPRNAQEAQPLTDAWAKKQLTRLAQLKEEWTKRGIPLFPVEQ